MSALRPLAENVAIARDNYLAAAQAHRDRAGQYRAGSQEWEAHRRLAAKFNLKAVEVCDVLAAPRRRRAVTVQ